MRVQLLLVHCRNKLKSSRGRGWVFCDGAPVKGPRVSVFLPSVYTHHGVKIQQRKIPAAQVVPRTHWLSFSSKLECLANSDRGQGSSEGTAKGARGIGGSLPSSQADGSSRVGRSSARAVRASFENVVCEQEWPSPWCVLKKALQACPPTPPLASQFPAFVTRCNPGCVTSLLARCIGPLFFSRGLEHQRQRGLSAQ